MQIMKTITYVLLLWTTTTIICFGQTNGYVKIGKYRWSESVIITNCSIDGTESDEGVITSNVGQKFRVINILENLAIIQILDYTEKVKEDNSARIIKPNSEFYKYNFRGSKTDFNNLADEDVNARNYGDRQRYFSVETRLIEKYAMDESVVGGTLAAGVINFPFKYRPQKDNKDFSGAFNFGAGIGFTFRHKKWRQLTHAIISGYSISNIVLDSPSVSKNADKLANTNNFSAFSFSLGYLIQYQQVQAGLFVGWDRLSNINQVEYDWNHQGKPWLSVGFGLAIFSGQKEKVEKNKSNEQ